MNARQLVFRGLAWITCFGLITLLYWLSLKTNGADAGIPQSWAIACWLAVGHTLFLILAYYWITRALYPAIIQQRWLSVLLQTLGLYVLIGLGTYFLYILVGDFFINVDARVARYHDRLKQAGAFASLTGLSIFLPNWWLYSILVTAVSLKISRDVYLTKTQALRLEMNLLRAQINPHFLFNTLNNIYSLVEEKDAYAAEILLKFGDIMRYTLYENNANFIALQQEITMLKEYIELEQIRYDAAAPATIQFNESGEYHSVVVPPLLLITLVENAFKHGTQAMIGASWIDINLRLEGERVHFQVSNSKPPVPASRSGRHTINVHRVGLDNIRRRLELLYPANHTLTVADKPDVYTVHLTIPKHGNSPLLSGR